MPEINNDADLYLSAQVSQVLTKADILIDNVAADIKAEATSAKEAAKEAIEKAEEAFNNSNEALSATATVNLDLLNMHGEIIESHMEINERLESEIERVISAMQTYTDDEITQAVSACNTFCDNKALETLSAAKTYTDEHVSLSLSAAKTYTDSRVFGKIPLPDGTDLNTITEAGEYSLGEACINIPEDWGEYTKYFSLKVTNVSGVGDVSFIQECSMSNFITYMRVFNATSATFTDWKPIGAITYGMSEGLATLDTGKYLVENVEAEHVYVKSKGYLSEVLPKLAPKITRIDRREYLTSGVITPPAGAVYMQFMLAAAGGHVTTSGGASSYMGVTCSGGETFFINNTIKGSGGEIIANINNLLNLAPRGQDAEYSYSISGTSIKVGKAGLGGSGSGGGGAMANIPGRGLTCGGNGFTVGGDGVIGKGTTNRGGLGGGGIGVYLGGGGGGGVFLSSIILASSSSLQIGAGGVNGDLKGGDGALIVWWYIGN